MNTVNCIGKSWFEFTTYLSIYHYLETSSSVLVYYLWLKITFRQNWQLLWVICILMQLCNYCGFSIINNNELFLNFWFDEYPSKGDDFLTDSYCFKLLRQKFSLYFFGLFSVLWCSLYCVIEIVFIVSSFLKLFMLFGLFIWNVFINFLSHK